MSNAQPTPDPTKRALLFLYTETPLHVGCGEGLGAIDLPIQRERMSGLPVAPGSGIKGALREVFRRTERELDLFGPEPPKKGAETKEPDHAGALTITDARLLLLPIRTVYGGWAWATSPLILERLARDLEIAGHARPAWADLAPGQHSSGNPPALIFADKPAIAPDGQSLILEDTLYAATRARDPGAKALLSTLEAALPAEASYGPTRKRLAGQLVVLSDEELKHWAHRGTEVVTRVRIADETGAVAKGALWSEEALPSESLLWSLALIHDSRRPRASENGAESSGRGALMTAFAEGLRPRIFLGGDRTIGRGLCGLNLYAKGS